MAEENPKKSNPKIFDVTKPDKVTPAATTKSIIVTNRPVLQDPMVVKSRMSGGSGEGDSAVANIDLVPPSEIRRRVQIYPFHDNTNDGVVSGAPEVKKTDIKKEADTSKAKNEPPVKLEVALPVDVTGANISVPPVPELAPDSAKPTDEKSNVTEPKDESLETAYTKPNEPKADTDISPAPKLLEATTEDTIKSAEETAAEGSAVHQKTDTEEPEAVSAEAANDDEHLPESTLTEGDSSAILGINEKADKEAKKKEEEQEKIIESGTYYLPINAVGHRKAVRHVVLGIVLVIVLAVLLLLVALDAGVLTIPGFPAPTNYL